MRRRPVIREIAGATFAVGLALAALAVVIGTDRGRLLLYDGDSVLLEIIRRSLLGGGPQDWSMSAVLFFFPEIPTYLVLRAVISTVQAAVIVNAVLNLTMLYLLLRSISAQLQGRAKGMPAALLAYGVAVTCIALEHGAEKETLELASLFIFPTYYAGALLAAFATFTLTIYLLRHRDDAQRRRSRIAAVAIFILATLSTASDPLFVVWGGAAIIGALLIAAILRVVRWRPAALAAMPVAFGIVVGLIARIPLGIYTSPVTWPYAHPGNQLHAAAYYPWLVLKRLGSGLPGVVEVVLLLALIIAAGVGIVLALRRRGRPELFVVAVIGFATPLGIYAFNVALGAESARYLEPIYYMPLLSILAVSAVIAERRTVLWPRLPFAPVAAAGLVLAIPAAVVLAPTAAGDYTRPDCLESWLNGRDLTGAGQFWQTRDLNAYGDESVQILQVVGGLGTFPWLVNLAPYYQGNPSYVVGDDAWMPEVEDQLGEPAQRITCPTYTILDYAGTEGAYLLRQAVTDTATSYGRDQGFLP